MKLKTEHFIFIDGQLDECELTLKNLHAIANCFNRILSSGVFHQRIEYPPLEAEGTAAKRKTKAKTNGKDKKPAEPDKDKQEVVDGGGERDLKRLGISKVGSKHSSGGRSTNHRTQ